MSGRNIKILNLAEIAAAKAAQPAHFKPQFVNGKWRKPKWSKRRIAWERKKVIQAGGVWPYDIPHKIVEKRILFKGRKRDLLRAEKQEHIRRCMAKMPELIQEYRANRVKKSKRVGLAAALTTPRTGLVFKN